MYNNLIPNNLDNFFFNKDLVNRLKNYNLDNMINICLYGSSNSGKKTIIKCLLNHLFNSNLLIQRSIETKDIKINNNSITIEYIVTPYHYEINLNEIGFYDKSVVTDFIYPLLEYKNINIGVIKIIVINNFDKLSRPAQLALRRMIEKTTHIAKFICIAKSTAHIDKVLLSRFQEIRVPRPKELDIISYVKYHLDKENILYDDLKIKELIDKNDKDLFKINLTLEYFIDNKSTDKYPINYSLSYVQEIIKLINKPNISSIYTIRSIVYKLLLVNIDSIELIQLIFKHYINSDIDDDTKNKILVITSCANHRASIIEHNIIVIEWYILQLKKLFTN